MTRKSDDRRAMLGKIHIAKTDLALTDDIYRDLLRRITGESSAADLNSRQLEQVVGEFERLGWKPKRGKTGPAPRHQRAKASSGPARKARALWLSAWHLGIITNPEEKALAAFVKRQTGRDALQWVTRADWSKVIEALKDMCARDGGVDWSPYASTTGPYEHPQGRVMEAQWRRLYALGEVRIGSVDALAMWAGKAAGAGCKICYTALSARDAYFVMGELGKRIRARQPARTVASS